MISELEKRVQRYWTQRSHDFGTVRRNELEDEMGRKWFRELEKHLPENGKLKVLDVGTGTGFFAVLLAQAGHRVEGVDLTPAMLEEARALPYTRLDTALVHAERAPLAGGPLWDLLTHPALRSLSGGVLGLTLPERAVSCSRFRLVPPRSISISGWPWVTVWPSLTLTVVTAVFGSRPTCVEISCRLMSVR